MVSLKNNTINKNPKPSAEAYANVISPSIANITAKLEALELYSLIPSTGSKGNIDDNISQATNIKSLLSNNEFKSLIKNIVQEVNNERVTPYMPYKNNRKPFYNNENFDQGFQNSYQRNNRNKNYNSHFENKNQPYSQQDFQNQNVYQNNQNPNRNNFYNNPCYPNYNNPQQNYNQHRNGQSNNRYDQQGVYGQPSYPKHRENYQEGNNNQKN
ncbi:hypothetical protein INT48_006674 [Thamnidium elegans]|uniref:Uncharacterized protein n=1 Tax=Thamnidium elegans TaxID=101142 RepID=A0A8H7SHU3_9FUNG|nr:hypothetical protein INT48_006674 [Thamnidium elegans]